MTSEQWFVKMDELAKNAIAHQRKEDGTDDVVAFYPPRFGDAYLQWMENVHDWVISRQLWWGHQIPAWYNEAGEMYVGEEAIFKGAVWLLMVCVIGYWLSVFWDYCEKLYHKNMYSIKLDKSIKN